MRLLCLRDLRAILDLQSGWNEGQPEESVFVFYVLSSSPSSGGMSDDDWSECVFFVNMSFRDPAPP